MIHLNLNLRNPFSCKFKNLWCRAFSTPFENKFIEVEVYQDSSLLSLGFNITARQSHSGVDFDIGLLGLCFHFVFYDSRHWNHAANRYEFVDD